ncbi:DgyrCDS9682 [Dimorphilus gyrociliatus]|uniref:Regucalcin n=1 Tax=Dimorphilus gyrociliatus TaxID=2664684 RepID=A0A7I8W0E9_9ANNE|nr:DgyrCDS9682 [Dimorphilus gyrociliatus]
MEPKWEVLIANAAKSIGEGPHWEEKSESLLYVDIYDNSCMRWNSKTGEIQTRNCGQTVGFIVPKKGNTDEYLLGLGQTISKLDWQTGNCEEIVRVEDGYSTRFNDGKCDPLGNLWAGTMGFETGPATVEPGLGSLYRLDKECKLRKEIGKISISNGLAWTIDLKTMFYIDSTPKELYAFDYDKESGNISNQRTVIKFDDAMGSPDGMTIDRNGYLWIAFYGSYQVIQFDPIKAKIVQSVKLPAKHITSCCFGGEDYSELYVTCARHNYTAKDMEKEPLAGSVFRITNTGSKGMPQNSYPG